MIRATLFNIRISVGQMGVYGSLIILLLGILIWSLSAGSYSLSLVEVISILLHPTGGYDELVIWDIRLPRVLLGATAGALLGASGAIFQSIIRNPLASPDVIGFNSGIALGAVVALVFFDASGYVLICSAIGGGMITALLVIVLAWQPQTGTVCLRKSTSRLGSLVRLWKYVNAYGFIPYRIVLIGIGCAFTITAITNLVLTTTDIYRASDVIIWLIGSVNGKSWDSVTIAFIGFFVLLPCALYLQKNMRDLELGNDTAVSLGVHINRTRLYAVFLGILLSAFAVSVVGPIGFVAFVSGPIARRMSTVAGINLGLSSLVGSIILTFSDLMGRTAIPGINLSAGIYTSIIGAPYLLWLLARNIRKGEL